MFNCRGYSTGENVDSQGRTRWYWDRNSENLLRIVVIHGECGNLKGFVYGGELTRNINEKKKPGVLQVYRYSLCDKCFRQDYFFNKHVEYWEPARFDFFVCVGSKYLEREETFSCSNE